MCLYGYKHRSVMELSFKDVCAAVNHGWQVFRVLSPSFLPVRTASSSILILSSCGFLPPCAKSWCSGGELIVWNRRGNQRCQVWAAFLTCCPTAVPDQLAFVTTSFTLLNHLWMHTFFFLASLIILIHSHLPPVSESELLSEHRSRTDALLPSSWAHLIKKH